METVAPHAGAWIETPLSDDDIRKLLVAPHAGAWIETRVQIFKLLNFYVAPHAGAWIETGYGNRLPTSHCSRTPRGCVD